MTQRSVFRDRVRRKAVILMPGVANPLSALVAGEIGFEALYVTGAGVSNFNLGLPDIGLMTLDDMCAAVARIRHVVDLPLVADADTGFGSAVNAYNAVRRLEAAGADAIQLEDQVFPKKCGHFDGKAVVAVGEMTDKIKAALDARRDADTLIVARTDARATDGFAAAVDRAAAFAETGADVLFVEALTSEDEVRRLPTLLGDVPLIMNVVFGGRTPALPLGDIGALGYRFALYANAALQGALRGMRTVLDELKSSGSLEGVRDALATFDERQHTIRKATFDELEQRYVRPTAEPVA